MPPLGLTQFCHTCRQRCEPVYFRKFRCRRKTLSGKFALAKQTETAKSQLRWAGRALNTVVPLSHLACRRCTRSLYDSKRNYTPSVALMSRASRNVSRVRLRVRNAAFARVFVRNRHIVSSLTADAPQGASLLLANGVPLTSDWQLQEELMRVRNGYMNCVLYAPSRSRPHGPNLEESVPLGSTRPLWRCYEDEDVGSRYYIHDKSLVCEWEGMLSFGYDLSSSFVRRALASGAARLLVEQEGCFVTFNEKRGEITLRGPVGQLPRLQGTVLDAISELVDSHLRAIPARRVHGQRYRLQLNDAPRRQGPAATAQHDRTR